MAMNNPTPYWRIILAAILDFFTAFFVLGSIIANLTGQTTEEGFSLQGWSALVFILLLIAYFIVGNRLGGTLWRRILKVPPSPR
jgi:hypothetical protein